MKTTIDTMPTTLISNNGRMTIPAAIRHKYGWRDGLRGFIVAFAGGFTFSLADEASATVVRKVSPQDWKLPDPTPLGKFRAGVEAWRDLANE
ncbi:MAG: AbrB/MazE/SpoVT family DNA-binding domain-containing protein [Kiritimatiellaeota bacterium]|nr:AbrB/MazE/SpoVT family DNA-binding domain-containing protein [Kiritimatiellota bacterium]